MDLLERNLRPSIKLTNLNQQPFPSSDLAGWNTNYATSGTGTATYETSGGQYGLPYFRMTWATASTVTTGGMERVVPAGALTPGSTYTVSLFVRLGRSQTLVLSAIPTQANGTTLATTSSPTYKLGTSGWFHMTLTFVAPANASGVILRVYSTSVNSGTAWAVGDKLEVTGVMLTEGGPVPYFDGNFSLASWEGTPGNSRSSTPALMGIYPVSRVYEMGALVLSSGHTIGATQLLDNGPLSTAVPTTEYSAHVAGSTNQRSNILNGGTSILSVGRNSAGTGWFALGVNPSGTVVSVNNSTAAAAMVVAAIREQLLLSVHVFTGNQVTSTAISGWPSQTTNPSVNGLAISSDIRYTELWQAAHPVDIRAARMAQIRTQYGIAA